MRGYFSVILGPGCNAHCPFCIAPPTMKDAAEPFPVERYLRAVEIAVAAGATRGSVSGGGEPLLMALRDRDAWVAIGEGLGAFSKRDLHSNYSIDLSRRSIDLFPPYTDVTVSLLPTPELNRLYMGYSRFKETVRLVQRDSAIVPFRLSATLGRDWIGGIDDVLEYVRFARGLGARAVTLRALQTPTYEGPAEWVREKYLSGEIVDGWLSARFEPIADTLRGARVYDVQGVRVCCYRYARETDGPDVDFLFFRPSTTTGLYGLYTEYDDDRSEIDC